MQKKCILILLFCLVCPMGFSSTPDIDDVRSVAKSVLRHRIVTNFNAEADGVNTVQIIDQLIQSDKP